MDPVQQQENVFNKVLKVTFVLLILILIGFGGFLYFRLNQNKTVDKLVPNSSVSPTISPAVQSEDPNNIDIGSVEADLKDIGVDVKGLQ